MSKRRSLGSLGEDTAPDFDDELEEDVYGDEETADTIAEPALAEEPLFSWLLRRRYSKLHQRMWF